MTALVAGAGDEEDDEASGEDGRALFVQIRDDPGNVSLNTVREEVAKLAAIRAVGLPSGVSAGIAPKVVASWRDRAAVESLSHLREDHPEEIKTDAARVTRCLKLRATASRCAARGPQCRSQQVRQGCDQAAERGDNGGQPVERAAAERQGAVAEIQDAQADGGDRQDDDHVVGDSFRVVLAKV